mgnify:CR=1 FL=1
MLEDHLLSTSTEMRSSPTDQDVKTIGLYKDTFGYNFISMSGITANCMAPSCVSIDFYHPVRLLCHKRNIESAYYCCDFFCLYLDTNVLPTSEYNSLSLNIYEKLKDSSLDDLIYEKLHIPKPLSACSLFKSTLHKLLQKKTIHNNFVKRLFKLLTKSSLEVAHIMNK